MPYNMESSSNKKSDDRIPRRPGYLEKSRDFQRTFRDDSFIKTSPLERQISELRSEIKKNEKILDQLRRDYDTLKKFPDLVRQKEDLLLIDKLGSLLRASEILDKSNKQVQIGISRSSGQQTEVSESIDIKSMDDGLNKSKEILNVLKTRGANTQELEDHLTSVEVHIDSIKKIIDADNKNNKLIHNYQEEINKWEKMLEFYKEDIIEYKRYSRGVKENIAHCLKSDSERSKQEDVFLEEFNQIVQEKFPGISLGSREVENKKINLISKEDEFKKTFNELTQYSSNICSYNQELRSIDEKFHQSDESWSQGEESFSHQIASNCVHQIFTENDPKEAVKLLKKIEKSSQKTEKYIQEKEEYLQVMKKYFREKAELLQEKAKLLQETAELLPNRLNSAKLIKKLNKGLFAYKLKSASSDFKELLSKLENELENQVDSQNMNLDKRSRDKKITELDQEINSVLKELDLGPSKKLSQAKRITKAEESLKSKHSEIDEAIQKIRRKNEGLQLEEGNLQKELDQLGKNTDRYNPYWVENHHEEQRDMIHQISEGGLKSIKIYLKNVSKGAVG